jgi:hypothetical protein
VLWNSHHTLHLALLRPAASEWDLRILAQLWHASDRYTRVVFDPYAVSPHDREAREAASLRSEPRPQLVLWHLLDRYKADRDTDWETAD